MLSKRLLNPCLATLVADLLHVDHFQVPTRARSRFLGFFFSLKSSISLIF